jgi:integrase
MAAGIRIRHARACAAREGGRCACKPTYQAQAYDQRSKRQVWRTFDTLSGAKQWRQDAQVALRRGTMAAPDGRTVEQAAREWLAAARRGEARTRSGDPYKPATIRAYDQSLRLRVFPRIGSVKLHSVRRVDLQDVADKLHSEGLAASTVQCAILPLRAVYRRAVSRGELAINPTTGLELPAIRNHRDRIASPAEARELLDALPADDRPLWATAIYAGLRRGELMALRWEDVDLAAGKIHVLRGWDTVEGEIAPKSASGRRVVPVAVALRDYLDQHRLTASDALVFGAAGKPFRPDQVRHRAEAAWIAAKLSRITLHECRHTFASLMIAAGVNAKALSTYMGHANIAITLDRYGHLMPGNEQEAAGLLDAYLARAAVAQTVVHPPEPQEIRAGAQMWNIAAPASRASRSITAATVVRASTSRAAAAASAKTPVAPAPSGPSSSSTISSTVTCDGSRAKL